MTLDVGLSSADDAMRQATITVNYYMEKAVESIDEMFGRGYAEKHPELVAAFMRTAAQDFHTTIMKAAAEDITEAIQRVARPEEDTTP